MKEQLTQLINAYAAARASGDPLLQQFAAGQLQAFLERVELSQIATTEESHNA